MFSLTLFERQNFFVHRLLRLSKRPGQFRAEAILPHSRLNNNPFALRKGWTTNRIRSMKSLLQTQAWVDFKAKQGWTVHRLPTFFVLERPLPLGKSLLYAPEVSLPEATTADLQSLIEQVGKLSDAAIFFRLEIFEELGEAEHPLTVPLIQTGFTKAFEETQPEHRQWVDISHDPATILAKMKEKGRYNIRLSERKGVRTRISTDTKDVEVFYHLFKTTAAREGFAIRSQQYFVDLCQMLFDHQLGELIIAEYQGRPLAALILTYYDGLASYLYGASSNDDRNVMAPYAAHWEAIQSAQAHDCIIYDLLQIAPKEAGEGHHYSALSRFKERFGGQAVQLVGGWDYPLQPVWYQLFKWAEKIRRR